MPEPDQNEEDLKPLGGVTIPAGEVSEEERNALVDKLYDRIMGNYSPDSAE